MNSTEKVMMKLFPEVEKNIVEREYHRKEFYIHDGIVKEKLEEFKKTLDELNVVKIGDVIKNFRFRNNRFIIDSIDIKITGITNKFISFVTEDGNEDIRIEKRKWQHERSKKGRINKRDFYTTILLRDDYKNIFRDFFIDSLI